MRDIILLLFSFFVLMLMGCELQPQEITSIPTLEIENTITDTPSKTPSPILSALPPSPSPTHTWTPNPTSTPTQTRTPIPSITPIVISPDPNEPQCLRREDLQETKISTVLDIITVPGRELFCVEWLDLFENEIGFRIILEYHHEAGGTFTYEVGPNFTQLIVPYEHAPRLGESQDQCKTRSAFTVQVIALGAEGTYLWSEQMVKEVDCNVFALPTSTITLAP